MSINVLPNYNAPNKTGLFRFWCQKVLPAVYDDSLSYYELLCKVVNYLNDVIENADTTNTNVDSLYNSFVQLQNYVNSYFDNLNLQDEINAKLDEFVADGTFTNILLGQYRYNIIMISDDYGIAPDENSGWCRHVKDALNLSDENYHIYAHNGSGFLGYEDSPTFADLLGNAVEQITDKNNITHIIVCGGYNDAARLKGGSYASDVRNGMREFGNIAQSNFPNAKIMVGCPAWGYADNSIHKYINSIINTYTQCMGPIKGSVYIGGLESILHYTGYLDNSKFRPKNVGSILIANCVVNAIKGCQFYTPTDGGEIVPTFKPVEGITSINVRNAKMQICDNTVWFNSQIISISGTLNFPVGIWAKIADISNTVMFGGASYDTSYRADIICTMGGESVVHCQIAIYDCSLYLLPISADINTTSLTSYGTMLSGPSSL